MRNDDEVEMKILSEKMYYNESYGLIVIKALAIDLVTILERDKLSNQFRISYNVVEKVKTFNITSINIKQSKHKGK